ncbi:site-specific integrase [Nitrosospira sp. Is2]|uniref:site-specific integrase n=1 Tax=Nitrosospira sp. Is2 TaxID=3080532 RepID=UPI0029534A1A|nr:site-specific integrase [Nitrosospira sp. Is2]WON72755.1 site-specific integrase [Nitrosospira sp. Is2]
MATVRKLSSGKWNAQVRRKGHSPISKSFTYEKDAHVWIRSIESDMDRGSYVNRSTADSTTLGEALERYRDEITPKKKGKDQELRRIAVWLKHPLARRSLSSLKGKDFAKHRDDRLLKRCSAGTLRLELALISHLYTIALKEWGIPVTNPVSLIRKPTANNARTRRLEDDEEDRLLNACRLSKNILLYPIAVLAIETAMKLSELLNMEWTDIDIKKRIIVLSDTKNGTARTIPLSLRAIDILSSIPKHIACRRVFFTWLPRSDAMNGAFKTAVKKAGMDNFHFHDLRHEATSRYFELGMNVMEVSAITGHKSLQMLRRYTHISNNVLINKLDGQIRAVS